MITLTRKLKKDGSSSSPDTSKRISVRDRLLIKEVQEMEQEMETNVCKVKGSGNIAKYTSVIN